MNRTRDRSHAQTTPAIASKAQTPTSSTALQLVSFLLWCQATRLGLQVRGVSWCKMSADTIPHADDVPSLFQARTEVVNKDHTHKYFSQTPPW